jgi:hypothetical protein
VYPNRECTLLFFQTFAFNKFEYEKYSYLDILYNFMFEYMYYENLSFKHECIQTFNINKVVMTTTKIKSGG